MQEKHLDLVRKLEALGDVLDGTFLRSVVLLKRDCCSHPALEEAQLVLKRETIMQATSSSWHFI